LVEDYEESVNRRFVERSLWGETRDVRPPEGFIEFEEFLKSNTKGGLVFDEIAEITEVEHGDKVYDFTVRNRNHNFVANGMVVSNCGVRLVRTELEKSDVSPKIKEISRQPIQERTFGSRF